MLQSYILNGLSRSELNTELRFIFASARVDGAQIVRLEITQSDDGELDRISGSVIKLLRSLKKEGSIEFYANDESFRANSTEAIFLLNKYSQYIPDEKVNKRFIFVKM